MIKVRGAGFVGALISILTFGCVSSDKRPPLEPVASVDLSRFMGDWYVMANIPTFLEKGAHNAIEHYELREDGNIDVRFTFRKGAFSGPEKVLTMTGFPMKEFNNARWEISPFWPLRLPYYTIDLAEDYSWVVVATPNRDYLWIMTRAKSIPASLLSELIDRAVAKGFLRESIQLVPQSW